MTTEEMTSGVAITVRTLSARRLPAFKVKSRAGISALLSPMKKLPTALAVGEPMSRAAADSKFELRCFWPGEVLPRFTTDGPDVFQVNEDGSPCRLAQGTDLADGVSRVIEVQIYG